MPIGRLTTGIDGHARCHERTRVHKRVQTHQCTCRAVDACTLSALSAGAYDSRMLDTLVTLAIVKHTPQPNAFTNADVPATYMHSHRRTSTESSGEVHRHARTVSNMFDMHNAALLVYYTHRCALPIATNGMMTISLISGYPHNTIVPIALVHALMPASSAHTPTSGLAGDHVVGEACGGSKHEQRQCGRRRKRPQLPQCPSGLCINIGDT
ncbi:unnamed protein product [Sphagnum balticum]